MLILKNINETKEKNLKWWNDIIEIKIMKSKGRGAYMIIRNNTKLQT
jgi:hypothetical protein